LSHNKAALVRFAAVFEGRAVFEGSASFFAAALAKINDLARRPRPENSYLLSQTLRPY
jgi:hypothetical protein